MWRHPSPLSSRAVKVLSAFLSSGHRNLGFSLEVPQGCHTCHCVKVDTEGDSRIGPWESVVSGVEWDIGVFWNGETTLEFLSTFKWRLPPLELPRKRWEREMDPYREMRREKWGSF